MSEATGGHRRHAFAAALCYQPHDALLHRIKAVVSLHQCEKLPFGLHSVAMDNHYFEWSLCLLFFFMAKSPQS